MIREEFRIYIEQLRDGHTENLKETLSPDFIGVCEEDLQFVDPVYLTGEAYLADDDLVMKFQCETLATVPCSICNEPTKVEIHIRDDYQMVPITEIKGGIYNFAELLRETLILECPRTTECHQGKCPQRSQVKKYLKDEKAEKKDDNGTYQPFADLDKLIK